MATNDFIVKNGLTVNDKAAVKSTTDASSATDTAAAVYTAGGLAIAKKAYVGTNLDVQGTSNLVGSVTVTGDVAVNGGDVTTTSTTGTLFNTGATTLNIGGAATALSIGSSTGTTTVNHAVTVSGAFTASPANANVAISPTGTGTVTISPAGALTINPAAASTINNTSIGASTRSTGAFTSLTSNAATTFTQNTASTSTTTGTLVVTGGVGVSGRINAANIDGIIGANSAAAGSFTTLTANNSVTFTQNTGSTSTTSGTLVVTGGVGISERLYAGSIQNTPIGSSVASTAAFTTLTSNGATTFTAGTASTTTGTGTLVVTGGIGLSGAVNAGASSTFAGLTSTSTTTLSPANASVTISPTGTGTVTIGPATAGTINNMSIGATTRAAGAFTTLGANGAVTIDTTTNNQSYTTTGAGTITISSGTAGTINNMSIGATTATTGRFTTVTSTVATGTAPFTVASTTLVANLNADMVDGLTVHTATNNEANKIVRTDGNGYIQAGWINTTSGDNGTTAIDRVYASNDGYIRYYTPTNFRAVLNVPTRTGGDASGTWGISVTGNAATATALSSDSGFLRDRATIAEADLDATITNGFRTVNKTGHSSTVLVWNSGGSTGPVQIDVSYSNDIRYRNKTDSTTWNAWKTFIHSVNYNSYSPTLTGTGASGTWGINVTGNSATVTDGVYLSTTQTISGSKTLSGTTTFSGALTSSSTATLPKLFINRSGNVASGISWYSSGYTSWAEYMAAAGATNVGPTGNITAPSGTFVTNWALRSIVETSSGYGWTWETASSTGQPAISAEMRYDGTFYTKGGIYAAGDIYSSYSDLNLKTVVAPVENAIDKVMQIDTIYYTPNKTAKELGIDTTDELRIGVTAQSVEAAEPLLVKPIAGHDKYNTVDYQRLTVLLIAAMKEQQKEIDMLKSKLGL